METQSTGCYVAHRPIASPIKDQSGAPGPQTAAGFGALRCSVITVSEIEDSFSSPVICQVELKESLPSSDFNEASICLLLFLSCLFHRCR